MRPLLSRVVVRTLVAAVALGGAASIGVRVARTAEGDLRLIGPQGVPIVVALPELMKVPELDIAAACASVEAHNARARRLRASTPETADDDEAEDTEHTVYKAAEAGCAGTGERGYEFYRDIGDVLRPTAKSTRFDADHMFASLREALRTAVSGEDITAIVLRLDSRASYLAERLHAPDFYLIAAEALVVRAQFCSGNDAARCRAETNRSRVEHLYDAGRWRADTDLLRAAIAAYREALHDVIDRSSEWVDLHTLIGSALAQLSEQHDGDERRALLRQALDEYEVARTAVGPEAEWTWALINQNVCSIRQPLAALDSDRAATRLAIEECEKARAYYAARKDRTSEAAAHYNMARAYERLAEWDHDEDAATRAVEYVRRCVQLYDEEGVMLSRAFAQVHLAEALIDLSEFASTRRDADRARALRAEARACLDAAEPILRDAGAKGYLERLTGIRGRLDGVKLPG